MCLRLERLFGALGGVFIYGDEGNGGARAKKKMYVSTFYQSQRAEGDGVDNSDGNW